MTESKYNNFFLHTSRRPRGLCQSLGWIRTALEQSHWQKNSVFPGAGLCSSIRSYAFRSFTYRWDINIRESTVLGLVGAGGMGLQLNASIMELAWSKVSIILIAIIITVIFSEWISAKVRHAII